MSIFPGSASAGQQFTTASNITYVFNGESWIVISTKGILNATSTNRPASPNEGQLIYETDTDLVLVWNGSEWAEISGGGSTVAFQANQPDTTDLEPGTLWVDSDQPTVNGLAAQTFLRWVKELSASATVISGNDDNSNPLLYTPEFEQVYINGTLLSRGDDYTATDGSTITLTEAGVSGDLIEIHAFESFILTNHYTKAASDAKYFLNSASSSFEPNIEYVSASPSGPVAGTLWIDSTNSAAPALKVYNGTTWIAVSGASEAGLHPFFQAGI